MGIDDSGLMGVTGVPGNYLNELREIKFLLLEGKYKAISAYKIPDDFWNWLQCPNCGLRPLIWEFNNGSSTACGCGENEYKNFSIYAESIMSYVTRNNGSAMGYNHKKLRENWNHWVLTLEELETHESLREQGKW